MNPRILSLGTALPKHRATQDEALHYFGWKSSLAKSIFKNTGIETRYSYVDPAKFAESPSWQELCELYEKGVVELGVAAGEDALGELDRNDVSLLTFSSVTGYLCPSSSYAIAAGLGLREDISHTNILGQGCQAAVPNVQRTYEYLRARGTGHALMTTVELCSCTWFPVENERDLEYIIASSLFGDGASAALLGYSDDPRYPEIVDFESYFTREYLDLLGFKWQDGRLKVVLDRRVPEIVPPAMKKVVDLILSRNGLSYGDIKHWMIHPGGKTVLEGIEQQLGLSHEQTVDSWEIMRTHGNMSSSTVGFIAKETQRRQPEGYGLVLTQGAGVAVNGMLLKWG